MKKVFISGSISIKKLNSEIIESLENIISKNYSVLIGDAPGTDTLIQNFFSKLNYNNVEVYSIFRSPRYIANKNFLSKYINVASEIKNERERQTYKDEAMSNYSDFSFVIWDGKSKGSFGNILRAIDSDKFAKVYYIFEDRFLEQTKINKNEIEFIYRTHNGYTASEVVEYLQNQGIEKFKKTQDLNKYLLEKNVIKKEDKIYLPTEKYSNLLITEMYKGKPSGIKFNNDFISWIEKEILSIPIQGELF